jgi:hypothetical protein
MWQAGQSTAPDTGEEFVLSDVPRNLKTSQSYPATLGVANASAVGWTAGSISLGYHWAYADGLTVLGVPEVFTPISHAVPSNVATAVTAKFTTPSAPGRYFLVWDVKNSAGQWGSVISQKIHPNATYPLMVTVNEGGKTNAQTLDLTKLFNTNAVATDGAHGGSMDDSGDAYPSDQLPPDGTNDTVSNPLLTGLPGTSYYPSGFYTTTSGHDTPFRFGPAKNGDNAIASSGQKIEIPSGYSNIHLLAASSGDSKTVQFSTDSTSQSVKIGSWSSVESDLKLGLKFPYHLKNGVVDTGAPSILYDVTIPTNGARSLTLPDDKDIKIFAITATR